jgi:hypothetical protein
MGGADTTGARMISRLRSESGAGHRPSRRMPPTPHLPEGQVPSETKCLRS